MWLFWISQLLSLLSDGMERFALQVFVHKNTMSATNLALLTILSELPSLLLAPLAGSLVDRSTSVKPLMVAADTVVALCTAFLFYLSSSDESIPPIAVFITSAIGSASNALQWSSFVVCMHASSEKPISKTSALIEAAPALSMLFAPLFGSYLLEAYGLNGVFAASISTYTFATIILAVTKLGARPTSKDIATRTSFWETVTEVGSFLAHPGPLRDIFSVLIVSMITVGAVQMAMLPAILNLDPNVTTLGTTLTLSGVGGAFGAGALYVYPVREQLHGHLWLAIVATQGVLLAWFGALPSLPCIMAVAVLYMFTVPMARTARQVLCRNTTSSDQLGRVTALQKGVMQVATPTAAGLAAMLMQTLQPYVAQPSYTIFLLLGGLNILTAALFWWRGAIHAAATVSLSHAPQTKQD
eukprot:m.4158 g.4158  ORF g.4158 m.4158 type:complete len:413 (+) comp4431_c0_seq1:76-1314(+)